MLLRDDADTAHATRPPSEPGQWKPVRPMRG